MQEDDPMEPEEPTETEPKPDELTLEEKADLRKSIAEASANFKEKLARGSGESAANGNTTGINGGN